MGKKHALIDTETLRRMYVDQGMSIREIARSVDRTYATIHKHLVNKGIPIRPAWKKIDLEKARALYVDKGWSLQKISERFGASDAAVFLRLKADGVQFRTLAAAKKLKPKRKKKPNPKTVIRLYVDRTLSLQEIGRRLKVPKAQVRQTLIDNGIEIRSQSFGKKDWVRPIYDLKKRKAIIITLPRHPDYCRGTIWRIAKKTGRRFSTRKLGPRQLQIKRLA